jgi:orotate phosphoribosyltransferase
LGSGYIIKAKGGICYGRKICGIFAQKPQYSDGSHPGAFHYKQLPVSHYLDMGTLKHNSTAAKEVAQELAIPYISCEIVDTIVCMEGTEIIGAYLAEELLKEGLLVMNADGNIDVISPMSNVNGQLIFQHNAPKLITNKNIILQVSSVSSGKTVYRALDSLSYLGGHLVGISSLFAPVPKVYGHEIHAVFTGEDIPDYSFFRAEECEMCNNGKKLDAIVNYGGYTEL